MTYLGLLKAFLNIYTFFSFNLSYLQCVCEMSVVWDELCVRWVVCDVGWVVYDVTWLLYDEISFVMCVFVRWVVCDVMYEMRCVRWVVSETRFVMCVWDELCEINGNCVRSTVSAADDGGRRRTTAGGMQARKQKPHSDVGNKCYCRIQVVKLSHVSRRMEHAQDGILGLSLDGLAMNRNFSTFDMPGAPGWKHHESTNATCKLPWFSGTIVYTCPSIVIILDPLNFARPGVKDRRLLHVVVRFFWGNLIVNTFVSMIPIW